MSKKDSKWKRILTGVLFYVIIIALWQLIYYLGVNVFNIWKSYSIPSPVGVAESFVSLSENGSLYIAILNSLLRGFIGFAIAIAIGVVFGFLINHFEYLNKNLKPLLLGVQTLPSVCWVPFSILWFGLSQQAIIFVVVMGSTFSISIAVDNAIRNVPPIYKNAALTMGAGKLQLYTRVIFPASIPALIAGLRQGWSFAWRSLMAGEVMTTSIGLGQTLLIGRNMGDISQVMLIMIIILLVGIIIDKCIFSSIEKRVLAKRGL